MDHSQRFATGPARGDVARATVVIDTTRDLARVVGVAQSHSAAFSSVLFGFGLRPV
jgi:hypothetical protein